MKTPQRLTPHQVMLPLLLTLILLVPQAALAHATLVFGTINTDPNPPDAEGFKLILHMMDPVRTPVENAIVFAEFGPPHALGEHDDAVGAAETLLEAGGTEAHEDFTRFAFTETGPGGNYEAVVQLPETGHYVLLLRDQTYPKEDAVAVVEFDVGGEPLEEILFVFPPTDIGTATLSTWLIWLIAIPLVAGAVVTVVVLAGGKKDASAAGMTSGQ